MMVSRAIQLFLTNVQLDKFSIYRGPVKIICPVKRMTKNETIIISKYRKILKLSLSPHTLR